MKVRFGYNAYCNSIFDLSRQKIQKFFKKKEKKLGGIV